MDQNQTIEPAEQHEDETTFLSLQSRLNDAHVQYSLLTHAACKTSEESAAARGATLASGAKAMLLRDASNGVFVLAVVSAARKLSWKLLKPLLGSKKVDIAKPEEVTALTKCVSGAIPPFGSLFGLRTYVDESLIEQGPDINFNCGLRTRSMNLKTNDFVEFEKPTIGKFTE